MNSAKNRHPILVLGVGNVLLRDEGVGVRVIEAMQGLPLPPGVELVDGGTAGADLLDIISDRRKVIVIDAMDADVEPGTVRRLRIEDLDDRESPRVSLHEIGLLDTFAMARHINSSPAEILLLGVQPKEVSPGTTLTDEMIAVLPGIIGQVLAELRG